MEVFRLIVDEKITGWRRTYVDITADSPEDALKMCIKKGPDAGRIYESEFLYDTESKVEPSYPGELTLEIMSPDYQILYSDDGNGR